MTSGNERRNSTLITWSLPISGVCFWLVVARGKFTLTNQEHYLDVSSDTVISMEFLHLFLRRQFAAKPVMASRNVGCFLKLKLLCQKNGRKSDMGHRDTHFNYLPTRCKTLCLTPLYVHLQICWQFDAYRAPRSQVSVGQSPRPKDACSLAENGLCRPGDEEECALASKQSKWTFLF